MSPPSRLRGVPTHALPLLVLLALPALSGCSFLSQVFQPPKVTFDRAVFKAADFETLRVDLHLAVHNPNILGVELSGYKVKFVVDDLTLLDGDIKQKLDLGAGSTGDLVVPVTFKWKAIASKVGDIVSGKPVPDFAPFRAVGNVRINTAIGEISVPFDFKGKIPVIAPPVVIPTAVRLQSASLSGITLAIDVDVENVTGRPLGLKRFDQVLRLSGRSVVIGRVTDNLPVAARSTEKRTATVTLSALEAGFSLLNLIQSGGRVDVRFLGSADIDTGIGVIPVTFDSHRGLRVAK
jgi:LEA14-like dessication related protein